MKDFFVYILKCADGSYYTGHTDNLEARLTAHKVCLTGCYTQKRRPIELVFVQCCATRVEVLSAEHQIKKWSRKKKEALIEKDWELLINLSKRQSLQ